MFRPPRAFTLPELLVVLTIVALLAAVAVPSMSRAVARYRLRVAVQARVDLLQRARATAVWRGNRVMVCPGDHRGCAERADWRARWIVWDQRLDAATEGESGLEDAFATLRSQGRDAIVFEPHGGTPGTNQTIVFCLTGDRASAVAIVIGNAGVPRLRPATAEQAARCAAQASRER